MTAASDHRILPGKSVAIETEGVFYKGYRLHSQNLKDQIESFDRAATIVVDDMTHQQVSVARRFSGLHGDHIEKTENAELQRRISVINDEKKQTGGNRELPSQLSLSTPGDNASESGEEYESDNKYTNFDAQSGIITQFERDIINRKPSVHYSKHLDHAPTKEPIGPCKFKDMIDMSKINKQLHADRLKQEELFKKNCVMRWKANQERQRDMLINKFRYMSTNASQGSFACCKSKRARSQSCSSISRKDVMENSQRVARMVRMQSAPPQILAQHVNELLRANNLKHHKDHLPNVNDTEDSSKRKMKSTVSVSWADEARKNTTKTSRAKSAGSLISYRLRNNVW